MNTPSFGVAILLSSFAVGCAGADPMSDKLVPQIDQLADAGRSDDAHAVQGVDAQETSDARADGLATPAVDAGIDACGRLYGDRDGDGFGDPNSSIVSCDVKDGWVANNTDCNDSTPVIFPGSVEQGSVDMNCNGVLEIANGTQFIEPAGFPDDRCRGSYPGFAPGWERHCGHDAQFLGCSNQRGIVVSTKFLLCK